MDRQTLIEPVVAFAAPPKRYKIGEVAAVTGLSRQTLHNYTRWGLIREVAWTEGGHRLYDESVFATLARVVERRRTASVAQIKVEMTVATTNTAPAKFAEGA